MSRHSMPGAQTSSPHAVAIQTLAPIGSPHRAGDRLAIAASPASTRVADVLAQLLADLGVTTAFGVGGGGVASVADAFARHRQIRVVHTRHESGAAFAATEASLATGRPTVVFSTTGPGITNALTGLFVARREGAQVIFVSGITPAPQRERGAMQETTTGVLLDGMYTAGPLFHYATTLEHPDQIQVAARRLARGLRCPGGFVAHVAAPIDVQSQHVRALPRAPDRDELRPERILDPSDVARCAELLQAGRSMLWVGFGARHCARRITALAERLQMPVMSTPRGKGIFSEMHSLYVGVTGLGGHEQARRAVRTVAPEHILVLGTRLGELSWGWDASLLPRRSLIHVDIDPEVPGCASPDLPTLGIQAEIGTFVDALLDILPAHVEPEPRDLPTLGRSHPLTPERSGPIRPQVLIDAVQRVIVDGTDALVIADAGNAFAWTINRLRFQRPGRYRANVGWASMGHASAGVIGAGLHHAAKTVAIVGDGAMLMNCEIGTAVQYDVPVVWVVINDSLYGMVDHGMRDAGFQPVETAMPRTDFAELARSMGARGLRITRERDLEAGLRQAMAAPGPFVLDVVVDSTIAPPNESRLDNLRAQGVRTKA